MSQIMICKNMTKGRNKMGTCPKEGYEWEKKGKNGKNIHNEKYRNWNNPKRRIRMGTFPKRRI